jgi:hypothetical protein
MDILIPEYLRNQNIHDVGMRFSTFEAGKKSWKK